MCKVSVIIPTYKRSKAICRAVDSVLSQTLDSFEVIVVDDNGITSEEGKNTAREMEKYANNPNVIYIRHEVNKNGSAARNTGIRASKGEYISFLDDDDKYCPCRLEKMSKKLDDVDDSWGACYSGYVKHQVNGQKQYSNERNEGNLYKQTLMRSLYIGSGSNLFFRRKVIEDVGFFDESFKRNQDLEYLVRVMSRYKMTYVDEVLLEIFYDINRVELSLEETKERENLFRSNFSRFVDLLDLKEQQEVRTMWDLDWMRILLERKQMVDAFHIMRKIPFKVLLKYIIYIIDRSLTNTSYGFVVHL